MSLNILARATRWSKVGLDHSEGSRCEEVVDKVEDRPSASNCLAPGDLHQVVDEGGHPVEEGHHDGLQEDHPDEAWAATVGVNEVDQVTEQEVIQELIKMGKKSPGSIAGKEDAGKKEDDTNGEGDEGLLGSQPAWCRLDEKGGDGLDHAHRGVEPKRPQHEEEEGAPQLGQWQGAHLEKLQSAKFL